MQHKIIDTHIHVWDTDRVQYKWLESEGPLLNRTYLLNELEPDVKQTGITAGILVQAANNKQDTLLMLECAGAYNWIRGIVGWLPLMDPEQTFEAIERLYKKNDIMKGVRHLIHNEEDPQWLLREEVMESLQLLATANIPYDVVGTTTSHLKTAISVSNKIPALKMALDHMNQPPIAGGEFGEWGSLMQEASTHDNIHCKISGLGTASGNPAYWDSETIAPYVMHVIRHFGTSRCFLGGDWPVSLLASSYNRTWTIYRSVIENEFSFSDQRRLFYDNAASFYNISDHRQLN
jgi:L-fuconolactonase